MAVLELFLVARRFQVPQVKDHQVLVEEGGDVVPLLGGEGPALGSRGLRARVVRQVVLAVDFVEWDRAVNRIIYSSLQFCILFFERW